MAATRALIELGQRILEKSRELNMPNVFEGKTTSERVVFHGGAKSNGCPAAGSDENNTFAKFSPGDPFYVDFTPADQ